MFIGVGILGRLGLGRRLGVRLRVLLDRRAWLVGFVDLLDGLLEWFRFAGLFDCLGTRIGRWLGLCVDRFRILGLVMRLDRILCLGLYSRIGIGRNLGDLVGRRCLPRFRICRCSRWAVGLGRGARPCGPPIGLAGALRLLRRPTRVLCWLPVRRVVLLSRDRILCSRILGNRSLFLRRCGFRRWWFETFAPCDPLMLAGDYRLRSGGLVLWR